MVGFRVFPSRGKSMYIAHIWPTGVAGGRAVREEPGGALYVHSPYAPSIVLPSTGVMADVYLQCLTTLVMGGNGLSRPGGNLGFRV